MNNEKFDLLLKNLHYAQERKNIQLEIAAQIQLGIYHYHNEDMQKAKLSFESALNLNTQIPEINYYLSLIALHEDKLVNAKHYLEVELKINPANKDAKTILEKLKINANIPLVTLFLLLINLVVFFFTYPKISLIETIKYTMSYDMFSITNAITSLFFHVNILHFTVNMTILLMFGIILEKHIGSLKFLVIYIVSGILGNMVQSIVYHNSFVLGASAALFGLLGAIILTDPLLELRIFGVIKTPIILVFGAFFAFNLLLQNYLSMLNIGMITGDIAHLMGFLCGILIAGIFYHEKISIFYNWLLIFAGFWLIEYALSNIINYYQNAKVLFLLLQFSYLAIAIGAIIFSYSLLKMKMLNRGEIQ